MASEIEICNLALSMLGQRPATNILNPESYPEQLCAQWYKTSRDYVVNAHDWSFAMARAELSGTILPEPVFGFGNQFPIPQDSLRIIWAGIQTDEKQYSEFDWRVEGDNILASNSVLYIRYIKRITDASVFKPLVVEAIAAKMAMEMAVPLTESRALRNDMMGMFATKLGEAVANDGMQGRSERIRSRKLLIAR